MLTFLNSFLLICDFCRPLKDALFCNPHTSSDDIHDSLNSCADRLFKIVTRLLLDYVEPLQLPDLHSDFNYTMITTYYGCIELSKGLLQNLITLHRAGDINFFTNPEIVQLTLPVGFTGLMFSYDYAVKISGLGPSGRIHGTLKNLTMEIAVGFDYKNLSVILEDFRILDSGDISFVFEGHFLIDWLLKLLTELSMALIKEDIVLSVEEIFKNALQIPFDKINGIVREVTHPRFLPLLLERLLGTI